MTSYDLVRRYHPNANDELCDYLLWEWTAYPMCGVRTLIRQLKDAAKASKEKKSVCFQCGGLFDNSGKVSPYDICGCCKAAVED